jgi:tRNA-uridine 2-sulfurtransferase
MKERVIVAMSGGVDSSVSAALLVEQGFDVMGLMLRLWSEPGIASRRDNRCCTRDQMLDAHFVAKKLGIPFEVVDVRDVFKQAIVDFFVDGYSKGITPNPCLECNRQIRFTFLLNEALARGATHLATGHYARVECGYSGVYALRRGNDPSKDQSYILSGLNQHQLSHAMFPIGSYLKSEVRGLAAQYGLRVENKTDSQDLCFVADGNYRRFMQAAAPAVFRRGPIQTRTGEIIGEHDGLPNYTVGQRKGLGISSTEPLYVIAKQQETNALIVGVRDELGGTHFKAVQMNWIAGSAPVQELEADVKIRYKASPIRGRIVPRGTQNADIWLDTSAPDITPGQAAVLYDGDLVLGCGIITLSDEN